MPSSAPQAVSSFAQGSVRVSSCRSSHMGFGPVMLRGSVPFWRTTGMVISWKKSGSFPWTHV